MTTTTDELTVGPSREPGARERSGARSGAVLGAASLVATAANYAFLLAAARVLGSDDYGALAALLGVLTVVLIPTGAIQLAVSREISQRTARADDQGASAFTYAALRLSALATVPLVAAALVLVVPVREILNIDSTVAVLLAAVGLVTALVSPVAVGVLQGEQRFGAIAAVYVIPFALRLALFLPLAFLGFRLGGAMYAVTASGIAVSSFALALLIEPLRRGARAARPALGHFLRYLGPVTLGLLGIAVLTTFDLLVVKARFAPDVAGEYAAASAFARVAFFVPTTILAVLFPRTAARQARGQETADILGRSLIVTAAFCGLLTLLYAMSGRGLVHSTFGPEFAEGGELLVPFTLSVSAFALANVLVGFHLSRGETRYAWIVLAAVAVQVPVLALVPGGVENVIWANVAVGAGLLVAHEALVGSSVPALRAGVVRLWQRVHLGRPQVIEATLVTAGTVALVAWLTWPILPELTSTAVGTNGSDSSGTISWLWRMQHEGYHLLGSTRHLLEGAPIGWEEANGLNLQWLLPYYPAYLAAGVVGEVAAYNLVVLAGYGLSGATMYLLARYLGCTPFVAAWAGLAYVIFPAHTARIEHASLTHLEVLVLAVLAAVAAAERPSALRFALLTLATLAAWLTSGYFGAMAAIGACAFAVGAAATIRPPRARIRLVAGTAAAALAGTAVLALLTVTPGVDSGARLGRELGDLDVYGLRLTELVVPAAGNRVVGDWARSFHSSRIHSSNLSETSNYVGLLTLALAVGWLALAWRRRRMLGLRQRAATAGLASVALVAVLFALPSPLRILGASITWTPSRIVWEFVPALRVSSRFTLLLMTALLPLAALGLNAARLALAERIRRPGLARAAPLALVAAAAAFTFLELSVPAVTRTFRTRPLPPEYTAVERAPDGILAEYPLRRSDIYSYWQREHGRPLVNGAPGGSEADEVRRTLVDPGSPGTAERLARLGVTAIVTRANALDFASESAPDRPNARWGPGYLLLARYPDGTSVWRVDARPAPALPILPSESFLEPTVHADGFVGYPLTGQTGILELLSPESPRVVRLSFDARSTSDKGWVLHVEGAQGAVAVPVAGPTRASFVVGLPAGRSQLALRVEPEPESGEYPIELSAPTAEYTRGAPELRAATRPLP